MPTKGPAGARSLTSKERRARLDKDRALLMEALDAIVNDLRERALWPASREDRAAAPPGSFVDADTVFRNASYSVYRSAWKLLPGEIIDLPQGDEDGGVDDDL